jgi:hypothetical protein
MCLKTAIKASTLCSIPAAIGFGGGVLSVAHPKVLVPCLLAGLIAGGVAALRGAGKVPSGSGGRDERLLYVAAGAMLALSLVFGFATGIVYTTKMGLIPAGVGVSLTLALLAAFTLTFVRRLLAREVPWVERLVRVVLPEAEARKDGEVATRH